MSWSNRLSPDWEPRSYWYVHGQAPRKPDPPSPPGLSMPEFVEELRRYLKCAICGTRVQRIERNLDTLTVHCHGDTECITVSPALIESMTKLDLAPAFGGKLLAEP